ESRGGHHAKGRPGRGRAPGGRVAAAAPQGRADRDARRQAPARAGDDDVRRRRRTGPQVRDRLARRHGHVSDDQGGGGLPRRPPPPGGGPARSDEIRSPLRPVARATPTRGRTRYVQYRLSLKDDDPSQVFPTDGRQGFVAGADKNSAILNVVAGGPAEGQAGA